MIILSLNDNMFLDNNMETNQPVWERYNPGYVDEEFVPYLRDKVQDDWGNTVSINMWEKQGCVPSLVEPALIRKNWGLRFMRQFDSDPCPNGFMGAGDSYCVREPLKFEPVFYTDKSFIAKRQFWDGYALANPGVRRVSEQTDLRSVNPLTGQYTVYYNPSQWSARRRYAYPVPDTSQQYDRSWYLPVERGYAKSATTDSYLA
jgi:hypothetical protein